VKSVIINADDYAMDEGVDAAVLTLARQGVVTATSAMVLSPRWPDAGRRLADVPVSRGLHLDLTSPFAEAGHAGLARPLARLMAAAYGGQLDRSAVRRAIDGQLDRFEAVTHAPPDFVDGHQHVHQLPGIRAELIAALRDRFGQASRAIALRVCAARRWRGLKAFIIEHTGACAFAALAGARAHPMNSDFAGVYGFSPRADLAGLWRGWLAGLQGERPLVMCHVAGDRAAAGFPDGIRAARVNEMKWLGSPAFEDLCAELGIKRAAWRGRG
jgi:chitin disaccharide deacetylase